MAEKVRSRLGPIGKIRLRVRIEINDHDGYCSGSENEYNCYMKTLMVDVPEDYPFDHELVEHDWGEQLVKITPRVHGESMYCENSSHAQHKMDAHCTRLTVISAEMYFSYI